MKHTLKKIEVNGTALQQARQIYTKNETELERYLDLLLTWNTKINLVSRSVSRETLREHVVHSLLPLALGLTLSHNRWIDAGTGGGLPGIPLAVSEKETFWILNDNVKKKMNVVEDITTTLNLKNTEVLPKSISLVDFQKGTGIATKHAFKISDLLRHLGSKPWKTILMWKGTADAENELSLSKRRLNTTLYSFNFGPEESFYEGKGLVLIKR